MHLLQNSLANYLLSVVRTMDFGTYINLDKKNQRIVFLEGINSDEKVGTSDYFINDYIPNAVKHLECCYETIVLFKIQKAPIT